MVIVEAQTLEELREKLKIEGEKVLRFFASNRLVANPSKTGLLIFRPNQAAISESKVSIELGGENVTESTEQKVLGITISNDLKWSKQIEQIKNDCHYRLSILRRLRKYLSCRQLKTIAEGIIMSRLRYCLPVWGSEFVRFDESDPSRAVFHDLQVLQNDTLRIITGNKRSDRVRVQDMLTATNMLSMNQLAAYNALIEIWKSRALSVPFLSSIHKNKRTADRTLRSETSNNLQAAITEPFALCTERLWNRSSDRLKRTNLLSIAKIEARATAKQLPQ